MSSVTNPPLGSVLVTGGCGFLGSHVVSLLLSRYPPSRASPTHISVLDLSTVRNRHDGADYYDGDLTDADTVRSIFQKVKPQVVIHTASPTAFVGADILHKVNVGGTKTLLAEAQSVGTVKAFVFTSSASVISDTQTDLVNADERFSVVTGQGEVYSDTKAQAESLVLAANRPPSNPTFCTTALRPSTLFGEGDIQMIPSVLWVLRSGKTAFLLGDNSNLFDFTYVGNAAHAHIVAAAKLLVASAASTTKSTDTITAGNLMLPASVDGEAFIVTNQTPIYFWDFSRVFWQTYYTLAAADGPPAYAPPAPVPRTIARPFAIAIALLMAWFAWLLRRGTPTLTRQKAVYSCMTRYFRSTKAERVLEYQPIWTLDAGIARTARWFRDREVEEAAAGKKKQ